VPVSPNLMARDRATGEIDASLAARVAVPRLDVGADKEERGSTLGDRSAAPICRAPPRSRRLRPCAPVRPRLHY